MKKHKKKIAFFTVILLVILYSFSASSTVETRKIIVTAYCGCSECCEWKRGNWKYLKLDFWNRYISKGKYKDDKFTGLSANGNTKKEYDPGIFSMRNVERPYMIPVRLLFFPWMFLSQKGTIAADTRYYPFGTEMYVPGYGWGVVDDRGGLIKGPDIIDIYFSSHSETIEWGRQSLEVEIVQKN